MLCILACAYATMLKSNQLTSAMDAKRSSDFKRGSGRLSQDQIKLLLDSHNKYRAQEGASNMKHMRWNSVLADMGQAWAERCAWGHGQPTGYNSPYDQLGQNNWAHTMDPIDVMEGMKAWYEEKQWYHYDTLQCDSGQMCGHYTQLVWADSEEVGCGMAFCPYLYNANLRNAHFLVCNYGPSGNWAGEPPFRKGLECSTCRSGHGWCTDGLCNTQCTSASSECECKAACQNCGTYQADTCSCDCPDGWGLADCSETCQDYDSNCGANPGWPTPSWCTMYPDMVDRKCPAFCGHCVAQNPPAQSGCPVNGPTGGGTDTGTGGSSTGGGASCGTPSSISASDQGIILSNLNRYRRSRPMVWDDELAALAQQSSDQCADGVDNGATDCSGGAIDQIKERYQPRDRFDAAFFSKYFSYSMEYNYPSGFRKWMSSDPANPVYESSVKKVGCGQTSCGSDIVFLCNFSPKL